MVPPGARGRPSGSPGGMAALLRGESVMKDKIRSTMLDLIDRLGDEKTPVESLRTYASCIFDLAQTLRILALAEEESHEWE